MSTKIPKKWYNELLKLCLVQSHSANEKLMYEYISNYIKKLNLNYKVDDIGNVLVTKGNAKIYPCIVSHMDTVHHFVDDFTIFSRKNKDEWFAKSGNKAAGIGGDDKCGIFACLYFLTILPNIKIVFFSKEEIGCKGSDNIDLNYFDNCSYIIQLDRRGKSDFIDKKFNEKTVSHKFASEAGAIKKKYGFKSTTGAITDSINLYDRDVGISCVNISSGYYNPHSSTEYIVVSELWNSIKLVEEIIKTLKHKRYKHNKPKVKTYSYKHNKTTWLKCDVCNSSRISSWIWYIEGRRYCWSCITKDKNIIKCGKCNKYGFVDKMIYSNNLHKFICKSCNSKTSKNLINRINEHNKKILQNENKIECSKCHQQVWKYWGKFDGESFICDECMETYEKIPHTATELCDNCYKEKPIATGVYTGRQIWAYDLHEHTPQFFCKSCIDAGWIDRCRKCNTHTNIVDGEHNYDTGEFICNECLSSIQPLQLEVKQEKVKEKDKKEL